LSVRAEQAIPLLVDRSVIRPSKGLEILEAEYRAGRYKVMGGLKRAAQRVSDQLEQGAANHPIEEIINRPDGRSGSDGTVVPSEAVIDKEYAPEPCPCGVPGCLLKHVRDVMYIAMRRRLSTGELVELDNGVVATPHLARILAGQRPSPGN